MLFFLQFSIGTIGCIVTSSRHRPFCFHNFVFLLNCLFVLYSNMQRATIISVCVIAVSKSHEFLLKVRRLSSFFSTRRLRFHVDASYFFHDDARDSTSTTSRCLFHDVGHYSYRGDRKRKVSEKAGKGTKRRWEESTTASFY